MAEITGNARIFREMQSADAMRQDMRQGILDRVRESSIVQDDEELPARYKSALQFQRSTADEMIDRQADVIEGIQQLKQEGDERQSALLEALDNVRFDAPDSAEIRRMLDAAIIRLDALASRTTGAALRWVWLKALGITGVGWGVMLAAVALLL